MWIPSEFLFGGVLCGVLGLSCILYVPLRLTASALIAYRHSREELESTVSSARHAVARAEAARDAANARVQALQAMLQQYQGTHGALKPPSRELLRTLRAALHPDRPPSPERMAQALLSLNQQYPGTD